MKQYEQYGRKRFRNCCLKKRRVTLFHTMNAAMQCIQYDASAFQTTIVLDCYDNNLAFGTVVNHDSYPGLEWHQFSF